MPSRKQMPTRAPALFLLVGMIAGLQFAREMLAPTELALSAAFLLTVLSLLLSLKRSGLWLNPHPRRLRRRKANSYQSHPRRLRRRKANSYQ
jgi:hypothetical protein